MKQKSIQPLRLKKLLVFQSGKELKQKFTIQSQHQKGRITSWINNKESSLNQYPSLLYLLKTRLYYKYNCKPENFFSKQITNLIKGNKTHQVSIFKDQMIFDFTVEFLRRLYQLIEIKDRLRKLPSFYLKYLVFFCKPIFRKAIINKAIHKYYEKKAEVYYLEHYCEPNPQKAPELFTNSKIFSTTINEDINNQRSVTTSNIFQTNFEYCTSNNYLRNRFIESMSELSLIYKNYNKTIMNTDNNFINESWSPYLNNINLPSAIDYSGEIFNRPRESIFVPEAGTFRSQHIHFQSISEKIKQKTQQMIFKLKAAQLKNQPSFKKVLSKNTTHLNMNIEKKMQPNILIEFNNNHKQYNKYVLPHTKSTGDIMKVSFVIYTNQNEYGRNKLKKKNRKQLTEFALSAPTMNNVNINIHNKVNISPTFINNNIRNRISQLKLVASASDKQLSPVVGKNTSRNKKEVNIHPYCVPLIKNNSKEILSKLLLMID